MTLANQAAPPASDMFGCDSWSRTTASPRLALRLKAIDRRVLPQLLITDRGGGHELAHPGGGPGLGIAGQIDHRRLLVCRAARRHTSGIINVKRSDSRTKLDCGSAHRREDCIRDLQTHHGVGGGSAPECTAATRP